MFHFFKKINIAVVALIAMLGLGACASTPVQESTGQFVDSSVITTRVKSALLADNDVSGLQINVKTYKGVVELSGFVDNYRQKQKAVNITRNTEGVVSVKDAMIIKRHTTRR